MWIILFSALDDFGVREINEIVRMGNSPNTTPSHSRMHEVKRKVADEALHGALRIAGLVSVILSRSYLSLIGHHRHQAGVLTSNGYLVSGVECQIAVCVLSDP